MLGPDYERPSVAVPESYLPSSTNVFPLVVLPPSQEAEEAGAASEDEEAPETGDGSATIVLPRRDEAVAPFLATNSVVFPVSLADPALGYLETVALLGNPSLLQSLQRVERAYATYGATRAEYLPDMTAGAGAEWGRRKAGSGDAEDIESYSLSGRVSWEADLFGATRWRVTGARADLAAADFSLDDARLALVSEIATGFVALRQAQESLRLTRANVEVQRDTCRIAEEKEKAGIASRLDLLSANAQLASTLAGIPTAEAAISADIRALELLCGVLPGAFDEFLREPGPIPPPSPLPETVPADLLRRRPDVRMAEENHKSAVAKVGVAHVNRFPNLSIGASGSLSSEELSSWSDAMKSLSLAPSFNWNFLSFGRLRNAERAAKAAAEESALAYRAAVLTALHEVETSWTRLNREAERTPYLLEAETDRAQALDIARELYTNGQADYLEVLSAQSSLLSARQALCQHRAELANLSIQLYKALGGPADDEYGAEEPADNADEAAVPETADDTETANDTDNADDADNVDEE